MNEKCDKEEKAVVDQAAETEESLCKGASGAGDKEPEDITVEEWTSGSSCND